LSSAASGAPRPTFEGGAQPTASVALRSTTMNGRRLFAVSVATLLAAVAAGTVVPLAQSGPRIEVTIAQGARTEATTGMVYVAISRDHKRTPIEQASPTGAPLFSKYIDAMRAGTPVPFGAADRGHPLASLSDL